MPVYTVSQVAEYLKEALNRDPLLGDLWVSGEVSNLSRSAAGHIYFTLKDAEAQLRCVMFRTNRDNPTLDNGVAVSAHGRVSFYEVRGELQLYVDIVQPQGLGILHLELERLKRRLEEEGLFEPSRKRPLPPFPQRIGVVTSEYGAVFHDIRNVLERRYPLAEVVFCPAAVQGERAASEIVDALRTLNEEGDVEVIILARGGGSLEELWPFNEEAVARAIYASPTPLISAVGHETDYTIADYVADVRAPTPSAAAELVVPDVTRLRAVVGELQRTAIQSLFLLVTTHRQGLERCLQRLQWHVPDVAGRRQRIDELTGLGWTRLSGVVGRQRERLVSLEQRMAALNPVRVLARGFAVVQRAGTGEVVTRTAQVQSGDSLTVTVSDGAFGAEVKDGAAG